MTIEAIIIVIFYYIIAFSVIIGLINLTRSNIFDNRQLKLRQKWAKHPSTHALRKRQLISVIIFASNDGTTVIDCLDSLINGIYKKYEIIIVDNGSNDNTKQIVRRIIEQKPNLPLRLVAKKKSDKRSQAIAYASRYVKGEMTLVIDASCVLSNAALKNMVTQMSEPTLNAIHANTQIEHSFQLYGLASSLIGIITVWSKKAGSYINPNQDNYNYAALYRTGFFQGIIKTTNKNALNDLNTLNKLNEKISYDSQAIVTVYKSTKTKNSPMSSRLGLGLPAILEPIIIIYMLYIAFRFDNPSYVLFAWFSFTILFSLAIWSDDSKYAFAKLKLTLLAPLAYILYISHAIIVQIWRLLNIMPSRI